MLIAINSCWKHLFPSGVSLYEISQSSELYLKVRLAQFPYLS